MLIGITGGIGSGKSTIAHALAAQGYAVYDCDKEAKRIIAQDKDVQAAIIALLGEEAFREAPSDQVPSTKVYNTAYVARRVFDEPELLDALNAIVHPAVKKDILQRSGLTAKRSRSKAVLFIESAILFESGLDVLCDRIVRVEAPEEVRLQRVLARDYGGQDTPDNRYKVRARMHAQMSPDRMTAGQAAKTIRLLNDGKTPVARLAGELLREIANKP